MTTRTQPAEKTPLLPPLAAIKAAQGSELPRGWHEGERFVTVCPDGLVIVTRVVDVDVAEEAQ